MSIRVITAAASIVISMFVFASASVAQQRLVLFIATTGVDAGDCTSSPCRTCRYALTQIPFGSRGLINFAPGVYSEPPNENIVCNIFYHRVVWLQGPLDADGNCIDPTQTVIRLTKPGASAFYVQDFAVAGMRCFTIEEAVGTDGKPVPLNGYAFSSRQHTVLDYGDVHVAVTGGVVLAEEMGMASCIAPVTIASDMIAYAAVSFGSKLNLGCPHTLPTRLNFSAYFAAATSFSMINARGATFSGDGAGTSTGLKCSGSRSEIVEPAAPHSFPGDQPCVLQP